jgi:hypothetical protein
MCVIDRWVNIIRLCKAIIRHLDGEPFVMPTLYEQDLRLFPGESPDNLQATEYEAEWFLKLRQ